MSTPINHNADGPATAISEDNFTTQGTTLLAVRGLDTGYDETQVLWDVSLEIMRGEVIALVGANGAGKSTLLAAISGLLPAWKGNISFLGQEITHSRTERIVKLGLAHVPQGRRLFPGLTVEENLRLGAYTRRAGSARAIADDLERVYSLLPKLRERRQQTAGSLSGGEQQMCAIGRGLMTRPALLLIDEMSLGLAPNIVDDILAAIDNIHRQEQLSFLLVEQDVQIALERAHRGYVIENGHIVLSGRASDLLKSEQIRTAYLGE
ncbi:MAG TPA: ABC transporter ATP-binding protein [Ktedonobacteraceae bacterium]|nr:ABC transporter ATP-binding protein [Ktedonobacteraceae bacterium]